MPVGTPYTVEELACIPHDVTLDEERIAATVRLVRDFRPTNDNEATEAKKVSDSISKALLQRPFDRDLFVNLLFDKFTSLFRNATWVRAPEPVQKYVLESEPKFTEHFFGRAFPELPAAVATAIFARRPHLAIEYLDHLIRGVAARNDGKARIHDYEVVETSDIMYCPIDRLILHGSTVESLARSYPEVKSRIEEIAVRVTRASNTPSIFPGTPTQRANCQAQCSKLLQQLAKAYIKQQVRQKDHRCVPRSNP